MRKFNPEKELNKIQKGNKNKIIIGVCLLLLIVAIGSSYAIYQIKYNKQIIYTTVEPFYSKDIILSVKLDDQEKSTNKFPTKEEGYVYSHTECENDNITNINWNDDSWKLNADINGPDKCTVFFVKSPFNMNSCENKAMSECLLTVGEKFTDFIAMDDPDNNARYIGADPNNYIWFNCDDYSNPSESTCEKWRIIGSFKNIEKVSSVSEEGIATYEKQNLIKIMRPDILGAIMWDIENSNNWSESSLQTYLNNNYLTEGDDGSWITGSKDKKYKPLTSATQQIIEKVKWHIGGWNTSNITAAQFYTYERGEEVPEGALSTWDGYIGLMHTSDFGYAVGGDTTREQCLAKGMYYWGNESSCWENDWVSAQRYQWTITPNSNSSSRVFEFSTYAGWGGHGFDATAASWEARPSLFLKSIVKMAGGDGSFATPYVLSIN